MTTLTETTSIQTLSVELAALRLAARLYRYANDPCGIILALPGCCFALPSLLSQRLRIPMDVFAVRPLRVPAESPCTIGAVTENGLVHLDADMISRQPWLHRELRAHIEREIQAARIEISCQRAARRAGHITDLASRHVLFVDDGEATAAELLAILEAFHQLHAERIVAAIPEHISAATPAVRNHADEVIEFRINLD